jgi:hypothetical protein
MKKPQATIHPVHFEDFDDHDFERLVFAYLLRTDKWQTLDWYGQVGSDLGRDIWGVRERNNYKVCIQCANRRRVPFNKVSGDIDKVVAGPKGLPNEFLLVTGGWISANLRDKINEYAAAKKIAHCETWAGPEFEERLRKDAESLLKRFVHGEPFPDAPEEIKAAVRTLKRRDEMRQEQSTKSQNVSPQQLTSNRRNEMLDSNSIRILQLAAQYGGQRVDAIYASSQLRSQPPSPKGEGLGRRLKSTRGLASLAGLF